MTLSSASLLVISLTLFQQNPYGSVTGTVTEFGTRKPIAGCIIRDLRSGRKAMTDSKGLYFLDRLSPGSCTLEATCDGYPITRFPAVTVAADSTTTFNMILPRLPKDRIKMPVYTPDSSVDYKMKFYNPERPRMRSPRDSTGGK